MELLPYKVLYSDGVTKCKKCSRQIQSGSIQIAIMMQSDEEDCQFPEWYHQQCFFQTRLPSTEASFDGFALLRYKDQMALRDDLGILNNDDAIETENDVTAIPDFGIEKAKFNQDSCEGCKQTFPRNDLRIMRVIYDENQNVTSNDVCDGKATWYHVLCFARFRSELNWWKSALPGFRKLSETDKKTVMNHIPLMKHQATRIQNIRNADLIELEKEIRAQNEEYFILYDSLVAYVSKVERREILTKNGQLMPDPDAETQILHHLTDIIFFGALKPCQKCQKGQLIFNNMTYKCTEVSAWTKCDYQDKSPQRQPVTIPQTLLIKYPFLNSYTSVRNRTLHCFRMTDECGYDLVYGPYKKPPLFNMEFVIIGYLKMTKKEVEKTIKKMGGKIVTRIHDKLAAVISTEEEVQKMGPQMLEARKCNIQVVSEDFLQSITDTDPILYIISRSLCDWGGDPYLRIDENDISTTRDVAFYTKSLPERVTYKCKDGTAVDPDCGLEDDAHVFCEKIKKTHVKYSVILGLVDIQNNRNSYYRMQLLKSNQLELYWVFESWGRTSTVIGNKCLRNYGKLDEARQRFQLVYKEKTGNNFGVADHQKRSNKFYHLDIEFSVPKKMSKAFIETKLSTPVFQLMEMLFDIKQMENMMTICDLDLKQMPLGKISQQQIQMAMLTLKEISTLIQHCGGDGQLRDASNKFYTLIPHAFEVECPPVIDSVEVVNAKNELLESLLNMELIYSFLNEENGEKVHPLDACYKKLKTEIVSLDRNAAEFKQLCEIAQNTHGDTHIGYTLEVLDIFKLKRQGEHEQFQAVQHLKPRLLLWHGSRLMNFVSILTNGLKVAPPEAFHTGYMFGKGIYFADAVSKSANYCHTDRQNNSGLMLMCEVALGDMRTVYHAQNITDIPNGTVHAVKGVGIYATNDWRIIDGLSAAYGKLVPNNIQTSLQYNEYVVYNPAQVKQKGAVEQFLWK